MKAQKVKLNEFKRTGPGELTAVVDVDRMTKLTDPIKGSKPINNRGEYPVEKKEFKAKEALSYARPHERKFAESVLETARNERKNFFARKTTQKLKKLLAPAVLDVADRVSIKRCRETGNYLVIIKVS